MVAAIFEMMGEALKKEELIRKAVKFYLVATMILLGGLVYGWISVVQPYLELKRAEANFALIWEVKQIQNSYYTHKQNAKKYLAARTDCLKTFFPQGLTAELDPKQECDGKISLKSADGTVVKSPDDNPFRFEITCQNKGVSVRPRLRKDFAQSDDGRKIAAYRKANDIDLIPLLEQGGWGLCQDFPSFSDLEQIENIRSTHFALEIQPIVKSRNQSDSPLIAITIKNTFDGPNRLTRGMYSTLFGISNQNLELIALKHPSEPKFALAWNCARFISMKFSKGEAKSFEMGLRKKSGKKRGTYKFHLTVGTRMRIKSNSLTIKI
jgi:hypothetical protein